MAFLKTAASLENLDLLAIEFRDPTGTPSRRKSPIATIAASFRHSTSCPVRQSSGFSPAYFTEGFGYAKYRNDDAHIARVLMRRA